MFSSFFYFFLSLCCPHMLFFALVVIFITMDYRSKEITFFILEPMPDGGIRLVWVSEVPPARHGRRSFQFIVGLFTCLGISFALPQFLPLHQTFFQSTCLSFSFLLLDFLSSSPLLISSDARFSWDASIRPTPAFSKFLPP